MPSIQKRPVIDSQKSSPPVLTVIPQMYLSTMVTSLGSNHHSYLVHFYLCCCGSRGGSFQFYITCLHFLTESNCLRQWVVHNITELSIGRNLFPVLAVRTHKELIAESHCRFCFRLQRSVSKAAQCHRFAQVNRQR